MAREHILVDSNGWKMVTLCERDKSADNPFCRRSGGIFTSLETTRFLPDEAVYLGLNDQADPQCPPYLAYAAPGTSRFSWFSLVFPCSSPSVFNYVPPRRIAADDEYIYLFGGQAGYAQVFSNFADGRVWRIRRDGLAGSPLSLSEYEKVLEAQLLGIPAAKALGAGFPEALNRLRADGLIQNEDDHTITSENGETTHEFPKDGLKLREKDERIVMIECQDAGYLNGNGKTHQPLPFGLRWDVSQHDVRGALGYPRYRFDHPEAGYRNEGFQLGGHMFVLSYKRTGIKGYYGLKGLNAFRILLKAKGEADYTPVEQLQRYEPGKALGMSVANALQKLSDSGIVAPESALQVSENNGMMEHFAPEHGVSLSEKDGKVDAVELRGLTDEKQKPYAGPLPFGLQWGQNKSALSKILNDRMAETGTFPFAPNYYAVRVVMGPYQLFLFYQTEGVATWENARGLARIRLERK